MNPKICLRCDWQGETGRGTCPNCGERPLYVVGASPSEVPGAGSQPDERNHEAASTTPTAPSDTPPLRSDPSSPPTATTGSSNRSARSIVAFVLTALVLTVTLSTWINAQEERPSPTAQDDAVLEPPASEASPSPQPAKHKVLQPPRKHVTTADAVPFSFRVPASGWVQFGSISLNKSEAGPQGAEAMIYWSSFPDGGYLDPTANTQIRASSC